MPKAGCDCRFMKQLTGSKNFSGIEWSSIQIVLKNLFNLDVFLWMGLKPGTTLFLENGIYNDKPWKVNQSKSEASSGVFRGEVSLLQYTSLLNEFLKKVSFGWTQTHGVLACWAITGMHFSTHHLLSWSYLSSAQPVQLCTAVLGNEEGAPWNEVQWKLCFTF